MNLAAMYPSATGASAEVASPAAPEPQEAPAAAATLPSPDPQSPPGAPPAQPEDPDQVDDEGGIDVHIDAAIAAAEKGAEGDKPAQAESADLTVDARPNFFAESDAAGNKIPAASATDYASVTALPYGLKPTEGFANAMQAAVKVGISQVEMQGWFGTWCDAARNPIKTTEAAAAAALQAEHGEQYEATLASAKAFIGKLEKTWPTVRGMLAQTGLGNDPAFINRCAARARQRVL